MERNETSRLGEPNPGPLPESVDGLRAILLALLTVLSGGALSKYVQRSFGFSIIGWILVLVGVLVAVTFKRWLRGLGIVIAILMVVVLVIDRPSPFEGVKASLQLLERDAQAYVGPSTFVWVTYSGVKVGKHELWLMVRHGRDNEYRYYPRVQPCKNGIPESRVKLSSVLNSWGDVVLIHTGALKQGDPVGVFVAVATPKSSADFKRVLATHGYCGAKIGAIRATDFPASGFTMLSGAVARVQAYKPQPKKVAPRPSPNPSPSPPTPHP
jgi:hypothetical protein